MSTFKKVPSLREVIPDFVDVQDLLVFDIGCGTGGLVRWLTKQGAQVVGLEYEGSTIQKARSRGTVKNERFLQASGDQLPIPNETFDVIFFSYSLHHIPKDQIAAALKDAQRILKATGKLIVIEPLPDGSSSNVYRPVVDETEILNFAYQIIQKQPASEINQLAEEFYAMDSFYEDFEALCQSMITVDPSREPKVEAHREEIEALFYKFGQRTDQGYAFEGRLRVNVFKKQSWLQ